jgi:hypothetical protein
MSELETDRKNGVDAAGRNGASKPLGANGRPLRKRKHGECDEWGWWEDRTLAEKILIGIGFGLLAIGLAFLFGWVVMLLWNWLMPEIFGLKRVTYWQAWGLLILCCILFKDFGSGHSNGRSDRKRRRHLRRYLREDQAGLKEAPECE